MRVFPASRRMRVLPLKVGVALVMAAQRMVPVGESRLSVRVTSPVVGWKWRVRVMVVA